MQYLAHPYNYNTLRPGDAYTRSWTLSSLAQVKYCPLFGVKALPELMMIYYQFGPDEVASIKFKWKYIIMPEGHIWKYRLQNGRNFVSGSICSNLPWTTD